MAAMAVACDPSSMNGRYECVRCTKRLQRFIIYPEGGFNAPPTEVRHLGPWAGARRGKIVRLKPQIRLALARDGWSVIKDARLEFSPAV